MGRRHRMRRQDMFLTGASLASLVLFFLLGHSYSGDKSRSTLSYSTTGPMAVGLWMAKETGAFGKYGVDPNLIFISSSPVMVPALIGGDVQGGIAGPNVVISAVSGALRSSPSRASPIVPIFASGSIRKSVASMNCAEKLWACRDSAQQRTV